MNLPNLPSLNATPNTSAPAAGPTANAGVSLPSFAQQQPTQQPATAPNFAPPPATPAPVGFADPFAGIGMAQPMDRTPSAPTGIDCIVEILNCEALQAPNMGTGYLVHYKIIDCKQHPDQVGQQYAWKNWAKNLQPFKTACAGFVKAIYGLGNSAADVATLQANADKAIKESFSEAQTFRGQHLRLITVGTKTRNGNDFTRHDWSHVKRSA